MSGKKIVFPDRFISGVATSAGQTEGAALEDGRGLSIWDVFARIPGKIYHDQLPDTADDFYHRYREDCKILRDLGVQSFRRPRPGRACFRRGRKSQRKRHRLLSQRVFRTEKVRNHAQCDAVSLGSSLCAAGGARLAEPRYRSEVRRLRLLCLPRIRGRSGLFRNAERADRDLRRLRSGGVRARAPRRAVRAPGQSQSPFGARTGRKGVPGGAEEQPDRHRDRYLEPGAGSPRQRTGMRDCRARERTCAFILSESGVQGGLQRLLQALAGRERYSPRGRRG